MSVLNTMLGDLERRGHRPPLSLAPREETHEPAAASAHLILVSDRRRRPVWLALLLAAVAAAVVAVWLWPRPAPGPASPPSPTSADAPTAAPVPAAAVEAPQRSELPPLAVERIAPPASTLGASAGEPSLAAPLGEPTLVQPMHPNSPTPRVSVAPEAAAPQSKAASQMTAASGSDSAEASADAASEPPASAPRALASEPAVAQSGGQSDLTRAMTLIARGRATEATQLLAAALLQRPAWHEARSALAALQAEAGDRQQALATLLGGVALDPNRFAPLAAQLQAELNDAAGALQTLDRVPPEGRDQAYHALAGAIAQRAGQHDTAVAEYGAALRVAPSNWLAWVGLAVSLQALGRDAQSLAAFQAAAGGRLSPEMRRFVEARIRAVQASAPSAAAPTR